MVINSKNKGANFERDLVKQLTSLLPGSEWKRIPSSGSMGTIMNEPTLAGDLNGRLKNFPTKFKVEAKIGYGGAKQFTLKKEWLDKVKAEALKTFSIPFLLGRFSGSRSGVEEFVVMDLNTFVQLLTLLDKASE